MGQRERLGMPLVGAGPNVGQDYAELNSTSGFILNLLGGMSYNGDATNSKCYSAAESTIISVDTFSDILKKAYITAYWAEIQISTQDLISLTAGVFIDCSVDKLFNTVTNLASSEGLSTVGGRVTGALPFEIKKCTEVYKHPDAFSAKERGNAYGKCASIVLNYTI